MHAHAPGPGPRSAAGNHADPAVVKFEIEWIAGADFRDSGQHSRNTVADHDIAAGKQAFVAFRMGGEPSGEIIEGVMISIDEAPHRCAQSRLELGGAGA
jgi:hypothetical protein